MHRRKKALRTKSKLYFADALYSTDLVSDEEVRLEFVSADGYVWTSEIFIWITPVLYPRTKKGIARLAVS